MVTKHKKQTEKDPLVPILFSGGRRSKFTPQNTYRYTGQMPAQALAQVMARQRRDAEAKDKGRFGQLWYRTTNKHKWWCGWHVSMGVLFYSMLLFCSALAQGFAFYTHQLQVHIAMLPVTACVVLMTWLALACRSTRCVILAALLHFALFVGTIGVLIQMTNQYEHHQFAPRKIVHELGLVVTIHLGALVVQSMVAFFNTLNCLSYRTALIVDQEVEAERVRTMMIESKDSMV